MTGLEETVVRLQRELSGRQDGRLPSVRSLAASYGCSTRTVQAALARLRERGVIESRPRSGSWRRGAGPVDAKPPERPGARELGERLARELLDGVHPWEVPMPSLKELARLWDCHVQTAAKALGPSIERGLLERRGRSFFPLRPRARKVLAKPHILCIGAAAADGHFWMDSDRETDFWRELGAQAATAGVGLVRRTWDGGRIGIGPDTVGVVASTWHQPDPMAVCRALSKLRVPVCIWVEEHILEGPSLDSPIRFHDQGYSTEIGGALARHLLDLGHSRIAFLSPWQASRWSRNRLKGLQDEAQKCGARVEAFCLEGESEWDRLIPAKTDPLLVQEFPEAVLERIVEGSARRVREFVMVELGWNRVRQDMAPLMERALASGATAWVGANDTCALNALGWLRQRGVSVPGEISVAGFDDISEALRSDLTSYRFSCDAMARAMIRQILSPRRNDPVLTRHQGMVVGRASTGPNRGR